MIYGKPGERVGPAVADEADHYMVCEACGEAFDMRDLEQVLHHEQAGHEPLRSPS